MTLSAVPAIQPGLESDPGAAAASSVRSRRLAVAGLSALVVLSAALRLEAIGTWYWVDEALSVGLAHHGLYEIPSLLLRDGSPPLWYLLLHGWMAVFGTSVAATHSMSLLFSLVTVPAAWFVTRRLFGDRAAWFVAALTTINPFVIYFGHETRMYSLVVLLGLAVAGFFIEAFVDGNRRSTWWFAGALTLLLYTHNWGLYTAFACVLALVPIALTTTDRSDLIKRAVLAFGLVAVCYLPWVPALVSQVNNTGAPWSFTPTIRGVVGELAALFRDERLLIALGLGAAVGLSPLLRARRSRDALAVTVLGILIAVPVVVGWLAAHLEPSWATRYLAVIVGPLLVVVGVGLSRAKGLGIAAFVVAAVLVLQPLSRLNGLPRPLDAKSNARQVAQIMSPRLAPEDVVIVAQPEGVPLLAAELGPGYRYASPTGRLDDPSLMDWRNAEDRLRAATYADLAPLIEGMRVGQRVLLVTPGNPASRTDTTWVQLFRAAARRTNRSLRADKRFALVDRVRGGGSYVTFDAVLFERVTNRTR